MKYGFADVLCRMRGILCQDIFHPIHFLWKQLIGSKRKLVVLIFGTLSIIVGIQLIYTTINSHPLIKHRSDPRKKYALSTIRNTREVNCTKEFKSRHLMTPVIGGRIANRIFLVGNLIAAADDSCYTPFLKNDVGLGQCFDLHNVAFMKVNTSNFKRIGESGWGKYSGPIAAAISTEYNWTIVGVRQSYKYFQNKKELIQSSFIFKEEIKVAVAKYFKENCLANRTKVGVHVRLTDFVHPEHVKTGYVISSLYYIVNAMVYFKNRFSGKDLVFIVVSDDIKWCRDVIQAPNTYFSPFNDPGKDLYILTQCDHNIITSGSFGWMGAWLNETGTVVYDKSFPRFNSTLWRGYRKADYYPDWWIGL